MKKILLGTTALVTAGLLAGPALASDPLKVTVGGNVVTGFYVIDADDVLGTSFESTKVALVARNIDIKAEGTLDNGLVAGIDAKLQLNNDWNSGNASNIANSSYASFRQLFAYLEGGFGRFEIGGTDGAAYKMHYTSPWFVPGNGVDSPNIYNGVSYGNFGFGPEIRTSTFSLMATDSNKVSYFTPRLAGFQLGVSYTPDASNNNPRANGLIVLRSDSGMNNVFEIAANYAGTFSGVDVGVDGFYVSGDGAATNTSAEEYGFGANLGYAGFTLGGAWYQSNDLDYQAGVNVARRDTGAQVWTLGLKYATGPWTVGVAYLDAQDDSSSVWRSGRESKTWQLGGGYNLGSGVDVGLDLQWAQNKRGDIGGAARTETYDTKSAGLVLAVAF